MLINIAHWQGACASRIVFYHTELRVVMAGCEDHVLALPEWPEYMY